MSFYRLKGYEIHADLTSGSDCDHRNSGGDAAAGVEQFQRQGDWNQVCFQFETEWYGDRILCSRLQRLGISCA